MIELRVETETMASLNNAKLKGDGANQHAKALAIQSADNELKKISYDATNPDNDYPPLEEECWSLTYGIQSELIKHYEKGICCFSSTAENPLLWSHYADEHKGICVEYGIDREPKPNLYKVLYDQPRIINTSAIARALLEDNKEAKAELDQMVLLRKAEPWKYEDEWRLFGKQGLQDSQLVLKSITFGLRCPAAVRHAMIASLGGRSGLIDFYEIHQTSGSFDLKSEPFEIEDYIHIPKTARSALEMFGGIKS